MTNFKTSKMPKGHILYSHTHVSIADPNKISRHPERSEGSLGVLSDAFKMAQETGRTLTEMLSMLAIMGILAMVGMKAYTTAVTKHKANELIYEAQKRATTIAMQITAGKTDVSTAEFTNATEYGVFGEPSYNATTNTFSIPLTGVNANICSQMKMTTGKDSAMVISGGCGNDLTLIFNTDLTSKVSALTSDGWTNEDGSVCPEETGYGSECRICVQGKYVDSDAVCQTLYGQEVRMCIDGTCMVKSAGTGCLYNSDCKNQIADGTETNCGTDGCFCFYNKNVDEATGPSGYVGSCKLKTAYTGTFPQDGMRDGVAYSTAQAEGYIRSSNFSNMDWFSAQNFCRSYNKNLVSFKDFGISFPNTASGCRNDTGSNPCDISDEDWTALRTKFFGSEALYPWTKDIVMPSKTRAYASDFVREYAYIYVYSRSGGRHALCR